MSRTPGLILLLTLTAATAMAQVDRNRVERDFRVEKKSLGECAKFTFGGLESCGQTLVMGQPIHMAFGSLAPQNGTGFGLAFVEHKDFISEWRDGFNFDAVASLNGSWRAGGYIKAYKLAGKTPHEEFPGAKGSTHKTGPFFNTAPLFGFYSQSISLNRVDYFGLGPDSTPLDHTTYGFSENITGMDGVIPLSGSMAPAKLALVGELNGRFPSVRGGSESSIPSIGELFNEATAPGLTHQAAYFEPAAGIRINPALFKDHIRLNYLLQFQQFIAPGNSSYSFRRWNGDFSHEIPLRSILPKQVGAHYYGGRASLYAHNGPDDCTGSSSNMAPAKAAAAAAKADPARPCPIISTTEKLEGSITLRAFISESFAGRGSLVPFYFSPTIGGSDINGTAMLASYPDYRFRGPDLLLFRGTLEHSLGKLPVGLLFSADEGKIGVRRGDVSIDHLRHTFTAGATIHAGGLPVIYLLFAWGGKEGTHATANVSQSLLGGGSRPSLF